MKKHRATLLLSWVILSSALSGCQALPETVTPPPYEGKPLQINTFQVKGLQFVKTLTYQGHFTHEQLLDDMRKYHCRYYVIVSSKTYNHDEVHNIMDENEMRKITVMVYQ